MMPEDIEKKIDALGFKITQLVYDETIMLSQDHDVGETVFICKMASILALVACATTLSGMLMLKADRDEFLDKYKKIFLETIGEAAEIKASDLVRH